jgi:hypothetical protein
MTAPTEWVPYVYPEAETRTVGTRRGLAVASVVCGLLGLLLGIFGVWGASLSLAAVVLALVARATQRRAGSLWKYGLASGLVGLAIAVGWLIYITQVLLPSRGY